MIKIPTTQPKILIIRFSSFGDIIKTSVLPRLLKKAYPEGKITFIVRDDFKELIEHNPYIDRKIYFEKRPKGIEVFSLLALRNVLGKEKFDIVIDAHNSLRSLILSVLFRTQFKARYNKSRIKRFLLFLLNINLLTMKKTQEGEFAKLLKPLGIVNDFEGSNLFFDKNKDYPKVLEKHGLKEHSYVCLVPGAAHNGKQLKAKLYINFIKELLKLKTTNKVVIMGGKKEIALAKKLESESCI